MFETLKKKANEYIQDSDWGDAAILKVCLCALGVLLGLHVKKEDKKAVGIVAFLVFVLTDALLVKNFLPYLFRKYETLQESNEE